MKEPNDETKELTAKRVIHIGHSLSTALAMAMLTGTTPPPGQNIFEDDRRFPVFPEPEFYHPEPRYKTPIVHSTVNRDQIKATRKQAAKNRRKRK